MIAPTEIPGATIISATETIDLEGVAHIWPALTDEEAVA